MALLLLQSSRGHYDKPLSSDGGDDEACEEARIANAPLHKWHGATHDPRASDIVWGLATVKCQKWQAGWLEAVFWVFLQGLTPEEIDNSYKLQMAAYVFILHSVLAQNPPLHLFLLTI